MNAKYYNLHLTDIYPPCRLHVVKHLINLYQACIMETQAVDISKKLIDICKLHMDEWHSLKGFVHDMIALGIQTKYKDLTPYATMKTDRQKEKKKEEREVFYTSKVNNIINKEKTKKWIFTENQIPQEFHYCKDLIAKFWAVKSGAKSEEAFKLLIGPKGLKGISTKYGKGTGVSAVLDQLEEAIANKWQSITLKNYEAFGRPQKADKEPVTNHPAGRLFKNGRFIDD